MPPHLLLKDLTIAFNRIPAVHHLNLSLSVGSCVGLLGPNGAGKTTLLKAIAGLLPIETGSIEFDGHCLQGKAPSKRHLLRTAIAYVPQREAIDWDFPITVRGLVEMGCYPEVGWWKPFQTSQQAKVENALRTFDLHPIAHRQISALSGGQQQLAFLARAWTQQSQIYLLDEPYTGLDKNARQAFTQTLHHMREAGKLILVSHHELQEVQEIFDHVLLLNGELVACGPTSSTFVSDLVERTFATQVFLGNSSVG